MTEGAFIIIIFYLLVFVFSNREPNDNEQIIINIHYNKKDNIFEINETKNIDENEIAYAIYNKSYERTGWDFLSISTYEKKDGKYDDNDKAYAMGYLEGFITKDRIYSYYVNMFHYIFWEFNFTIPEELKEFFKKNIEYMEKKFLEKSESEKYWEHVYYIYRQLKGLHDGYNAAVDEDKKIKDFYDFILIPSGIELSDILKNVHEDKVPNFNEMKGEDIKRYFLFNSHCSALIKLADDYSDIWFGHNTWNIYNSMIRIFKEYRFVSNKGNEKSKTIVFSSYPATLYSLDDFYFMDSKLLAMETTNSIFDNKLYKKIKPESLLTWIRTMVANRLASSAEDWTNIFKEENSGTYNNQFMILDINKIDLQNETIPEKSLMIIEQIPGEVEILDVTNQLKERHYWPSYNIPYSENFFDILGYKKRIEDEPDLYTYFDYKNCSRAKIFERDQSKIKSNEDFKKLLRYNDYKNDNFSENEPSLTIASRYDLFGVGFCNGATDAKFVSVKELLEGKFYTHIISGPTNDQQPTFSWENSTCHKSLPEMWYKEGLVDTWNFDWVEYKTQLFRLNNTNKEEKDDEKDNEKDDKKDDEKDDKKDDEKNDKKDDEKNDKKDDEDDDNKALVICFSIGSAIVIIIIIVIIVLFLRSKNTYDKLNEKINQISFADDDRDIRDTMI